MGTISIGIAWEAAALPLSYTRILKALDTHCLHVWLFSGSKTSWLPIHGNARCIKSFYAIRQQASFLETDDVATSDRHKVTNAGTVLRRPHGLRITNA